MWNRSMTERRFTRKQPKVWEGATLLLDGDNILVRSMFAAKRAEMSSTDGVVTGPLVIFINQVSKYVRDVNPSRVALCWDGGKSAFRVGIDSQYKASRISPNDDDYQLRDNTWTLAREFLTLSGIYHNRVPRVEADDLIAAYWRDHTEPVVIVSGDKDFFQLLDDTTWQLLPGNPEPFTEMSLVLNMGCTAKQIPLVMALTGDSVDDIKGVPGFGTKTAVKFLSKYDWDLERLLQEDAKLAEHGERARMNLKLVDLRSALPGLSVLRPPTFKATKLGMPMWDLLMGFCDRLQLATVRHKLESDTLWQ